MCVDELLAVTSHFVKDVVDVLDGDLVVGIGDGGVTVLLLLQFHDLTLLIR